LIEEIVEPLGKKLALIDLETNIVNQPEQMGEVGQLQFDHVIGMDLDHAGGRFIHPIGDLPHRAHAGPVELVHLALQARDDVALDRDAGDRGGAEHRVLHEHEKHDRQQGATLEGRQRHRVANEAAERLAL
jgi:hypothetical protein